MGSFIRHIDYKGHATTIYYEDETDNFYGYIESGCKTPFSFSGKTIEEAVDAFMEYVDNRAQADDAVES